jgi:hypothetical protein
VSYFMFITFNIISIHHYLPFDITHYIQYIYILVYAAVSNGKRKTEAEVIFLNPLQFAHRGNESLSFVRLLSVCKRTKRTCTSMLLTLFPFVVISHLTFCPARHLLLLTLHMSFHHYFPFDVFSFRYFFTIRRFFCRPFVTFDNFSGYVFYRRSFLLRRIVRESLLTVGAYHCVVKYRNSRNIRINSIVWKALQC